MQRKSIICVSIILIIMKFITEILKRVGDLKLLRNESFLFINQLKISRIFPSCIVFINALLLSDYLDSHIDWFGVSH